MNHSGIRRTGRLGLVAATLALLASPAFAHGFKVGELEIGHPWARMTPAGAKVGGGYLTVHNEGKDADTLLAATADVAGKVEIHQMSVKDGIMTMRPLPDGVAIPAGGDLALAPGGYHLMMMDLKQQLKEGESFKGTLTFAKAGTVNVEFKVEGIAGPKGAPSGAASGVAPENHDAHSGHAAPPSN